MAHLRLDQGALVLLAASALSAVLGSVHAFSVFLEPLEARFLVPRSQISLTYSMALVALTFAVLIGPNLFARWTAAKFTLGVGAVAAAGAMGAGMAESLLGVWLGYSLLFGAANGLGYGFGLQIAAQANPGREGFAMGVVTSAYALGAVIAPVLFEQAVTWAGFKGAMTGLMIALLCVSAFSALLLRQARAQFRAAPAVGRQSNLTLRSLAMLWAGYFGGCVAGLMVIGHAAGIAAAKVPGTALWIAPAAIAIFNLVGSLICGRLSDHIPPSRLLVGLPVITVFAVTGLAIETGFEVMLVCLGLVGFSYGGIIASYPAAIAKLYGVLEGPHVYGRVFTAWGTAGLVGPWFAGYLFDRSGGYQTALLVAACASILSIVSAFRCKSV